jgi:hypothetical protein
MTLKPAGEANSVTARPDSLKQAAVSRATDVYVSIRKRLWQDLHPRVYINIRNPDLSYLVNNTAFNFWTRVAQRNAAFDAIYAGSPTPASGGGGTAQPRQLASPAATAGPHPEAKVMAAPHSGAAIQERLAAINADSLDARSARPPAMASPSSKTSSPMPSARSPSGTSRQSRRSRLRRWAVACAATAANRQPPSARSSTS